MTLSDFRETLLEKSLGRTVLPEDPKLKERIHVGLKLIAKETVPLRLVVSDPTGFTILRRIDTTTYIRVPNIPKEEDTEIDIENDLIDALSYYVMAGLERSNAKQYMAFYHQEIDLNNDRLIETVLSDSTNQSGWNEVYV